MSEAPGGGARSAGGQESGSAGLILILGASGQLGAELQRVYSVERGGEQGGQGGRRVVALSRGEADLSRPEELRARVRALQPGLILNAAAYTAVDRAEAEPELADLVNHRAVAVLAEEARRAGALLVHYSTDYVFDGQKQGAWVETDATGPLNVYGQSKLDGERALAARCERHLVLRTSWVYGPRGKNFLTTMLRLRAERPVVRVVTDQVGAPTSAAALARATRQMTDRMLQGAGPELWGTYHATCAGATSWHGFAEAIFAAARGGAGLEVGVGAGLGVGVPVAREAVLEGIPSCEYPTPAVRPANSVLSNAKLLETFGVALPSWQQALGEVVARLAAEAGVQAGASVEGGREA